MESKKPNHNLKFVLSREEGEKELVKTHCNHRDQPGGFQLINVSYVQPEEACDEEQLHLLRYNY